MNVRNPPRWVATFLRALERAGKVEAAADDAAIDKSTAYYRRKAHPQFAAAWDQALAARKVRVAEEEREMIEAVRMHRGPDPSTISSSGNGPPPRGKLGEEFAICAGQVKRVNAARWNKAAEWRFFAALADTANVKAAADSAGFSTTAVYARRLRNPVFREQWAAAVETGRARLELALIEAANKAFETATAGVPAEAPGVSVAEALQILKIGAEQRPPIGRDGRRRLNAGASANYRVADNKEIADALAKRLVTFARRVEREKDGGGGRAE